jgi:hypothetical protein
MNEEALAKLLKFLSTGLRYQPHAVLHTHTTTENGVVMLQLADQAGGVEAEIRYLPTMPVEVVSLDFPQEG